MSWFEYMVAADEAQSLRRQCRAVVRQRDEALARISALEAAARAVVDNATGGYRARNGRECYIEDGSGEAMMIIPHEDWHNLETVLDVATLDTPSDGER